MSNQLRACNIFGAGAICANAGGTIVPVVSDCRMKTGFLPVGYGLNEIEKLNPVSFLWNDEWKEHNGCDRQIGFLAQEVKEVIPEAVFKTSNSYYGFDSSKLIPVIVSGVKELRKEFKTCSDSTDKCLCDLSKRIDTLSALIGK